MKEKFRFECIVIIFIIFYITLTSSLKSKHRPCTQNGPCVCVFPNGNRVNITKLADHDFHWTKLNTTADISFHPCIDKPIGTKEPSNECFSGASICIRVNQTVNETKYFNLGSSLDGKFSSLNPNEPISLQFPKHDRLTVIKLYCDENKTSEPNLSATEENNNYVLQLKSHEACLTGVEPSTSGLSFGSGLILAFLVFFLVYFIGGILTLKFLRGAEGKEMIPNYEFWADLPYLVRDGILFTLNGFQNSPSYDRI